MTRALFLSILLAAVYGCVSDEAIIPVREPGISLLCVKRNPDLARPDFVAEIRRSLEARGLRTLEYDGNAPPECRYRLLYWGEWRWDLKEYLRFAALHVYDGTKLVGQSTYDDRYDAALGKYRPTAEKVAVMVDKLFPAAR
jgi:hypothetical protein